MEACAALPLSQPSIFPPKPIRNTSVFPSRPCKELRSFPFQSSTRLNCSKMYVPGYGEASPEAKAAKNLHNFFNYIAVKIVSAQLQSYNPEAYKDLMEFLERNSLNDGDKFCANLMRESSRHKSLALRILEVRSAYCKNDFEWDNLKRLATKMVGECNTRLMQEYVLETTSLITEKETGK
ncbi:hypothetical protein SLE2022_344680 [Rubroshorea leprosula]